MNSRLLSSLLFSVFLLSTSNAFASDAYTYCYRDAEPCFPTLEQAEQYMKQGSYIRSQLELRYTDVSPHDPKIIRMNYSAKDSAPESIEPVRYTGHRGGEYACPPNGCASEDEVVQLLQAEHAESNGVCTYTIGERLGSYMEPLQEISAGAMGRWGSINFKNPDDTRRVEILEHCPWGSVVLLEHGITKWQKFLCPEDYESKSYNSSDGYGDVLRVYLSGKWCRADLGSGDSGDWITAHLTQIESCPANEHPCYPATGDKARFVTDFEFGGRPFQRFYHSTRQVAAYPFFARGWSHSFSDRVSIDYNLDLAVLVSERGYLEVFRRTADDSVYEYTSELSGDRYLIRYPGDGYQLLDGNGIVKYFDNAGRLISYEDTGDRVRFSFEYENEILKSAVDAQGRVINFKYSAGMLQAIELPDGGVVEYSRDREFNLAGVTYPDGETKMYIYNEPSLSAPGHANKLTGIIDEGGSRYATFGYDDRGRVVSSQVSGVERTELTYITSDLVEVVKPSGEVLTYTIKAGKYRRIASIEGAASVTSFSYSGSKPDRISRDGVVTSYAYSGGRLASITEAVGTPQEREMAIDRDADYGLISKTYYGYVDGLRTLASMETWTRNSRGQALIHTRHEPAAGLSHSTVATYCEQADIDAGTCPLLGLVTSVNGPRTDVPDLTTYTYYPSDAPNCTTAPTTCPHRKGDLWKVTNALGQVTETLRYDGAGRVLSVKDPNGVVTDFDYHPRGWLTARMVRGPDAGTEADDAITRIEYAPTGLVTKVIQPDGAFTAYEYDAAHRLIAIEDNYGNRTAYTLDSAGNRLREDTTDSDGVLLRTLSRVYNQLGQLQTAKDAYGHATGHTYDAAGRTDTITDALGRVTDNDYDPLGRLTRTLQDVAGIAAETRFEYDALDNLTKVIDPKGLFTKYQYNAFGDLIRLTSPDTGITTYTYDSAGNRVSATDARGKLTVYTYDALNRLTGVGYDATKLNVSYIYDVAPSICAAGETFAIGRLSKMLDGSGSTEYCYDRHGELVRKVQNTAGHSFSVRYTYTPGGRLQSITYPSGLRVDYTRNALGQTTAVQATPDGGPVQTLLSNVTWYPFGPAAELTYGDGRSLKRSLDQNYRPGFVEDIAPGGLSLGYQFDAVGNLATLRHGDQSEPPLRRYGYDALNRLTEVRDGATEALLQGYTYDATGNRTSATIGGTVIPYTIDADSHRLRKVGNTVRWYDATGNTVSIGGEAREFVYNAAGRMRMAKRNDVPIMRYEYNGKGEQVRRHPSETSTAQTFAVYDTAGRVLGRYDVAGERIQEHIWLDDLPIGVLVDKLYYVQADHLGTPRTVIDPGRQVAVWNWPLTGESFGNTPPDQDPGSDGVEFVFDLRFPGQQYDAASGLNYNLHRDYETAIGRYVESDPIGLIGGIATYEYAHSSPFMWQDARGLSPISCANIQNRVGVGTVGTIQCDGNGGFEIVNCASSCMSRCTGVHESQHVADYKARYGSKGCANRARGDIPDDETAAPFDLTPYDQFRAMSECRAYAASKRCAQNVLQTSCGCEQEAKMTISSADAQRREYSCSAYGL